MVPKARSTILTWLFVLGASMAVLKTCKTFVQVPESTLGRRAALFQASLLAVTPVVQPAHAEVAHERSAIDVQLAMAASPACNAEDLKLWNGGVKTKMPSTMADCVTKTEEVLGPPLIWSDRCIKKFISRNGQDQTPKPGQACMSNCVAKSMKLSPTCSNCFGALAQCTFENCAGQCIDADSEICKTCTGKFCIPAFEACAGLPK
eukprot:TRINITY_DN46995_c0_g1_i1.p1 TRINITY_DN46995_c0_g1~~TRINITY_DN46995_c0_g1_i1.p1  ORF type:complete len:205 (-),score=26.71 TRINITY_DN46995_c0_g1_i1:101-715(-)